MGTNFKINGDKNIEHGTIKSKLGITDKKIHTTFYLEGGAFITPNDDNDDFQYIMKTIESSCKNSLKKRLMFNNDFERNFLMNFEICSDRMKKDKKSYFYFQYHFKQKNNKNESIINVKEKNYEFFKDILNDIESQMYHFNIKISKDKKD